MLVLTRREGEEVIINVPASSEPQLVRLVVVKADRGRAKIGFDADRTVSIDRLEVLLGGPGGNAPTPPPA